MAAVLVALLAVLPLAGCGGEGDSGGEDGRGSGPPASKLLEADAPIGALAWDATEEALYGLERDGSRLVEIDPEVLTGIEFDGPRPDAVSGATELDGAGENLAVDGRTPGEIYVPSPDPAEVRVFGTEDLSGGQEFDVGVPPARVALDPLSDVLFALSKDGSTVTRVELSGNDVVAETRTEGGRATLIEAPGGRSGALWVAGPGGVTLYGGPSLTSGGSAPFDAGTLAAAEENAARAYAGQAGGGRVVALELAREDRLEVADKAEVGGTVEALAADGERVYAATRDAVAVLRAGDLGTVETVDLGPLLRRSPVRDVEPSALALSERHVYVAFDKEPYVLRFEKP